MIFVASGAFVALAVAFGLTSRLFRDWRENDAILDVIDADAMP